MYCELIKEQVDLYEPPALDKRYQSKPGTEITLGDLHGNALKLLFMLMKHGVIRHVSKRDYNILVDLYTQDNLKKQDLDDFTQLLNSFTWQAGGLIRLLGDELADRGSNDYFTLHIFQQLQQHQIPFEIMLSNHGIEFVEAYEKNTEFFPHTLASQFSSSMTNLEKLISAEMVKREDIMMIINQAYKPALRALSYTLSEDQQMLIIYTHAGAGLSNIFGLATKLGISYKEDTAGALASTINDINHHVQAQVQANAVHTLYNYENLKAGYNGDLGIAAESAFEFIIVNRNNTILTRPYLHEGYNLYFVHGHDSTDLTQGNIFDLDNFLGKGPGLNQGEYTALYLAQ